MNIMSNYTLRSLHEDDLPTLLAWRNNPEVRRYMLTQHEISPREHRDWFQKVNEDHDQCLLILEKQNLAMGYVQFSGIRSEFTEWGFYVAPGSPKGSGSKLAKAALTHAFGRLGLNKVRGKAMSFNVASIKLHRRFGFLQESVQEEVTLDDGRTECLLCFVLDRQSWHALQKVHGKF